MLMSCMRVAAAIELTNKEREKLEGIRKSRASAVRAQERAAIVLLAAEGCTNQEIAGRLGQDKMKVGRWRHRYAKHGLSGILKDKSRPGRFPPIAPAIRSRIVRLTLE